MPMGMRPVPEIFQRKLKQAMDGLPGIKNIADDILIVGEGDNDKEDMQGHGMKLRRLLERCMDLNVKLHRDELQLRLKEVPYITYITSVITYCRQMG